MLQSYLESCPKELLLDVQVAEWTLEHKLSVIHQIKVILAITDQLINRNEVLHVNNQFQLVWILSILYEL